MYKGLKVEVIRRWVLSLNRGAMYLSVWPMSPKRYFDLMPNIKISSYLFCLEGQYTCVQNEFSEEN